METWELAEQEDFESVLIETLSRSWADQYGQHFDIAAPSVQWQGQQWLLEPTFTTLYTRDVSHAGRRFMMDRFRFTPVTARVPFQWMVGTALGSRVRLSLRKRALFRVDPPVPGAANLLIIPGSRRVRTFDLSAGLSRSLLKVGYPLDAISNEVGVRGEDRAGPFFPVTQVGADRTWFEEPIVDGFPLPRCPPWWPHQLYETRILRALNEWSSLDAQPIPARTLAEELSRRISAGRQELLGRFGDVPLPGASFVEVLMKAAEPLGEIELVQSHGDLQPGNIHVERSSRRVYLIDWEHTARRSRSYDFMTYGLRARYPKGLGARILNFIAQPANGIAFEPLALSSRPARASALALFLLEDLDRSIADATGSPYGRLPYGFRVVCRELCMVEIELKRSLLTA